MEFCSLGSGSSGNSFIVKNNQTGAEKLLQKYNNSWDCNINKIFTEDAF